MKGVTKCYRGSGLTKPDRVSGESEPIFRPEPGNCGTLRAEGLVAVLSGSRSEQRGWYWYDWAASAFSVSVVAVFFGPYLTDLAQAAETAGQQASLFGVVSVTAESYYPSVAAIALALQIVVMPIVGAIADSVRSRRTVLGVCAYVGAVGVMGMWFVQAGNYQLGGLLFVVTTVAFGSAMTVYNSFLPLIADIDERDRVSSVAWAMGYAGGVLLLVANIGLFLGGEGLGISEADATRVAILSAGVWWAVFTIIPLRRLRAGTRTAETATSSVRDGLSRLGGTARTLRAYPQALLFLVAFFFYYDGIQTMIGLSATYAVEELGLQTTTVIVSVVVVQIIGIVGALLLGRLARRRGAKRVVVASLVLWVVGVLAVFALPVGNALLYLLAAGFIGFILGGSQALSRSLFAQLVPKERSGGFFSLFEVVSSAGALLGPLVFAVTLQFADSYRFGLLFLVVFFVLGGVVLSRVNMAAGMERAESDSVELAQER